jgi:hypothetical protein
VCCDCFSIRIDKYSSKEVKESIFLVEAREMQNHLLKAAEELQDAPQSPLPSILLPPTSVRINSISLVESGFQRIETLVWKLRRSTV